MRAGIDRSRREIKENPALTSLPARLFKPAGAQFCCEKHKITAKVRFRNYLSSLQTEIRVFMREEYHLRTMSMLIGSVA